MQPEQQKEVKKDDKFDLTVHHVDSVTGQVTHKTPYILRVFGDHPNKKRLFERPVGSGNLFYGDNKPAGRWDYSAKNGENYKADAPHVAWEAPMTEDQRVAIENATLKAELAALKAEGSAKKKDKGA